MENGPVIGVVLALSFALSFFMSGMEAGVFALSRLRIRQLMRAGKLRAKVLHGYLERPEDFLWTILVGNTLANFVAGSLAGVAPAPRLCCRPPLVWGIFFVGGFFFFPALRAFPQKAFCCVPHPRVP